MQRAFGHGRVFFHGAARDVDYDLLFSGLEEREFFLVSFFF